jgi:hypothetical protein
MTALYKSSYACIFRALLVGAKPFRFAVWLSNRFGNIQSGQDQA